MSQPTAQFTFKDLDNEAYLAKRLWEHGAVVFNGDTDPVIRRARFRKAILDAGLDCTVIGRGPNSKPETYAQAFARIFNEPLQPPTRKGK